MSVYIFPIFLFGCAITGIVFLGIQQAADWAKDEALRRLKAGESSDKLNPRSTLDMANPQ